MAANRFDRVSQAGIGVPDSQPIPEAHSWVEAEREIGEAPVVRKREERKSWRRHQNPLDMDLKGTLLDLVAETSHPRAEIALGKTGDFARKPGGILAPRTDHGTIADRRVDEKASEDGLDKNRKPVLSPNVQVGHSAEGQVAPADCQPEFARTRSLPFVVSDEIPAPATVLFQALARRQ